MGRERFLVGESPCLCFASHSRNPRNSRLKNFVKKEEEGLLNRTRIYATDISAVALKTAKAAVYSASKVAASLENHRLAGGSEDLWTYFVPEGGTARLRPDLRRHILYSGHNLVTDGPFNEFHAIVWRNVLIYFTGPLRDRVLNLFHGSLVKFGLLGLGTGETLHFTAVEKKFRALDGTNRLYRRIS